MYRICQGPFQDFLAVFPSCRNALTLEDFQRSHVGKTKIIFCGTGFTLLGMDFRARLITLFTGLFSAAAAIAVSAWISAIVACVIAALFLLVAGLAMTGTFGSTRVRGDAQTVLAILLGRTHAGGKDALKK